MNKMQYRLYNALRPPSSFKDATNIVRQHPLYPTVWMLIYRGKKLCTYCWERHLLLVHSADSPAEISRVQAVRSANPVIIFYGTSVPIEAQRLINRGMSMNETKSLRGEI